MRKINFDHTGEVAMHGKCSHSLFVVAVLFFFQSLLLTQIESGGKDETRAGGDVGAASSGWNDQWVAVKSSPPLSLLTARARMKSKS